MDTQIIQRAKAGDTAAFETLVRQYRTRVYNTILSLCQDPAEAEDLSQDTFVDAWLHLSKFEERSQFGTWLYRIAVNKALGFLRKRKVRDGFRRLLLHQTKGHADFVHPGIKLENRETATRLFKALDTLPERQKTAFTLFHLEGLSYKEISEVMESTEKAVEGLLLRASDGMRKRLGNFYRETGSFALPALTGPGLPL
ncbi:MAG: RNA polymerase sigma factor [Bacteroidota bacterium]